MVVWTLVVALLRRRPRSRAPLLWRDFCSASPSVGRVRRLSQTRHLIGVERGGKRWQGCRLLRRRKDASVASVVAWLVMLGYRLL